MWIKQSQIRKITLSFVAKLFSKFDRQRLFGEEVVDQFSLKSLTSK